MKQSWQGVIGSVVWVLAAFVGSSAHASLGGSPLPGARAASVPPQRAGSSAAEGYTVYTSAQPGGGEVREFVSSTHRVFAVAWRGPFLPDLRALLGARFGDYADAAASGQQGSPGRRPVDVSTLGLVIHSAGHPRAFHGLVYLPDALPKGFSVATLH
jgi:hypothetical protein